MKRRTFGEVAEQMDNARRANNLSVRATARLVGVAHTTVQGWLSGRHRPTPALRPQFEELMRSLGVEATIPDDWWELDTALSHLGEGGSPYVGLRPFTQEDAPVFFGRERESKRLAERIASDATPNGMVVVLGPSGSGKSSLLAAGLVAGQCGRGGVLAGRSAVLVTPTSLDAIPFDPPELVIIDQFEEALQLPGDDLGAVVGRACDLAGRTTVVVGVRSDAFGRLSELPELAEALQRPFLVSPMTDDELRDAIVKPAEFGGIAVQPGLVEIILRDVASESGVSLAALPMVSNALLLTWGVASANELKVEDYQRAGGVSSAIEELSEGVYGHLDPHEQGLAKSAFLNMVRLTGDAIHRKPMTLEGVSPEMDAVIQQFINARILTATETGVQISHEALFAQWPRLASWIDESRDDLRTREHLRRAAQLWVDSDRDEATLIPVERLPIFDSFLSAPGRRALLSPVESEFLDASSEHFDSVLTAERRNSARFRHRGRVAASFAAVALVLTLITGVALANSVIVSRQAQSRQIALQSRAFSKRDANMQAQFALASYRVSHTVESASSLIEASGVELPTRWPGDEGAYLAVSPGRDLVARADGLGKVTLWETESLETSPGETFVADPKERMLFSVGLAESGGRRIMAVGGFGGARALWDITEEPFLIKDLSSSEDTCYRAVFSADGATLALGLSDGSIEFWSLEDPNSPELSQRLEHGEPVSALAFHPEEPILYVGGQSDEVSVYGIDGRTVMQADTLTWGSDEKIRAQSLAVSPDGRWLAAGLAGHRFLLWDLSAQEPRFVPELPEPRGWVNSVSFSADSTELVVGDSGQNVTVLDAASGQITALYSAPTLVTDAFEVGDRVVATGIDGYLRIWADGPRTLLREGDALFQVDTDSEGKMWLVTTPSGSGEVALWDIRSGFERVPVPLPDAPVVLSVGVSVSGDGSVLVGGTRDGGVITWRLDDGEASEPRLWQVFDEGNMAEFGVSPDGGLIAAAQYTGEHTALLQRQADGSYSMVASLDTPTPQMVSFSPDGNLLQVGLGSNSVQLWDVSDPANPSVVGEIDTGTVPNASDFSPDGKRIAVGSYANLVTVWDVSDPSTPRLEHSFQESQVEITFVSFSADGTRLAAGNDGGMIYGWNVDEKDPRAKIAIDSQLDRAYDGVFLDGGATFAGGGVNGALRLWDVEADSVVDKVCQRRGEALTDVEWARFLPGVKQRELCQ